jgi:hypothetical protein
MSHPGIELQVNIPAGTIMRLNSDMVRLLCLRHSLGDPNQWHELLPAINGIGILARPVELPDLDVDQADVDPKPPPGLYRCGSAKCGDLWLHDSLGWRRLREESMTLSPTGMSWEQFLEDGSGDCTSNLIRVDVP